MSRSSLVFKAVSAGLLLLAIFGCRQLVLGGAKPISLKSDSLTAAVENSFASSASNSYLPIDGQDYSISRINYFDDGLWAVAQLTPINNLTDPAKVVLKKDGSYRSVMGPSNFFTDSDYAKLPTDVADFIKAEGSQNAGQ
jgi:hypothetical protein